MLTTTKQNPGKLEHTGFESIVLPQTGFARKEVAAGPAFGVDVALVDLPGDMALAMTSDPLSLIPSLGLQESAWLSVQLMANDMATTGFAPQYAQFVLNLPATLSREDFQTYWGHIHQYCKDIGVAITGGHTGSIEGQNSTIAGGGTMLLTAPKDNIRLSKNAQPGDVIIVTKTAALSSTAILAMSFPETIKNKLGMEVWQQACASFYQTSSLQDGLLAVKGATPTEVTALHDVTEGGILGAIYELAVASGSGVQVYDEKLPVGNVQQQIASLFGLDPRFCIGAGSMIITAKPEQVPALIKRLSQHDIPAVEVGVITPAKEGSIWITSEGKQPLPYHSQDPYWAAFFNAYKNGWK